ncbi:hypothetical protein KAM448_07340 [Aeromonas caviae]|uniref:Uncharacterized protein n=1 Tax=Aeromonas caviae TaxID=648 RepID=A0AA37FWT9_AERCA|nr:hypothetical protein KAM376_28490 [Aeromonas caviae]GJA05416.1 hypothetical protein KAM333_08440 [Aeromonas caviae]GJA17957.1 hypothetical protein KAM336_09780 [Aeromonas caviae]GJA26770.1 hypothetical protein KAM340_09370 [Aeromonas caviae]GJA65197.1 hypothetical protein KAM351_38080 [Aeromonas caviae]
MHRLGLEQQIVEWQGEQGLNLGQGPVVTKGVGARGESIHTWLPVVIGGILRRAQESVRRKTRQLDSATPGRARSQVAEIVG